MAATMSGRPWAAGVAVTLTLALALAGCASAPDAIDPARVVDIAPGVTLTLPPNPALGRTVEAAQLVTARYQDHVFAFEGRVSVTPERFLLVGLDTMGRRALTVTWTAAGVGFDAASWLPDTVRPGNILADIVLIYWPDAAVRAALAGATLDSGAGGRTVRGADGAELVHIDYDTATAGAWSGHPRLRNLAWGYALDVQSREVAP